MLTTLGLLARYDRVVSCPALRVIGGEIAELSVRRDSDARKSGHGPR